MGNFKEDIARIRAFVFDVDGVMTDGGITVTPAGERSKMTVGADGSVMHSLLGDKSGTVSVKLLKTSSVNAALQISESVPTADECVSSPDESPYPSGNGTALPCPKMPAARRLLQLLRLSRPYPARK